MNWEKVYKYKTIKDIFHASIAHGYIDIVRLLLETNDKVADKFHITLSYTPDEKNIAFMAAIISQHADILKLLLEDSRITMSSNQLLLMSAAHVANPDIIELLLGNERINITGHILNKILEIVVSRGLLDVVKLLLKDQRIDPHINFILAAVYQGHVDIVKLLLSDPRFDPSATHNAALIQSCDNGDAETIRVLLVDLRVDATTKNNQLIKTVKDLDVLSILRGDPSIPLKLKMRGINKKLLLSIVMLDATELLDKVNSDVAVAELVITKFFWLARLELLYDRDVTALTRADDPLKICMDEFVNNEA